jgi:nucleotide-binding universal stress UspA family protein
MIAPVVVGVDDIEHSAQAVDLAAREAELRGAPLWIGHAYQWVPPVAAGLTPGGDTPEGFVRDAADELLARAVAAVHIGHPELEVHSYAMSGRAAPCLAALAKDASLLVVGGRGGGGFTGLLLGSVALGAASHARCPVLVTRGTPAVPNRRIVVGVDIDEPETVGEPLGFALQEAGLRDADVTVLHGWEDPAWSYPILVGVYSPDQVEQLNGRRQRRLDARLAPWRDKHPEAGIDSRVLVGPPAGLLVGASRQADLIVLGGRRRDGTGMRLGALAHIVLHHAHCPVVIVPED